MTERSYWEELYEAKVKVVADWQERVEVAAEAERERLRELFDVSDNR